jgi:hypothetical protein
MTKGKWSVLLLPFVMCCSVFSADPARAMRRPHPAVTIGPDTISFEAIDFRLAQDRCMRDTIATRVSALAELIADELEYEVLKRAWHEWPPDSAIRKTAANLPRVTHDSDALACIEGIGNSTFFLQNYIRPTLVNPRLYARYFSDTNIHRAARDSIIAIFRRLLPHPDLFLTYPLDTIVIKRHEEQPPPNPLLEKEGEREKAVEQLPLVRNVLSKLSSRKLWPNIVESDYDFSIVMLDTVTDSIYRALAIRVAKRPFDVWYRDYVKQYVSIHFLDRALEIDLRKKYPTLWWMQD